MFHSFFPKPRLLFGSFIVWALFCVILWFSGASGWGAALSLGDLFGRGYPDALASSASEAEKAAFAAARGRALDFWYYPVSYTHLTLPTTSRV